MPPDSLTHKDTLTPRSSDANYLHGRGINLLIICVVLNAVGALLLTSRLVARLRIGRLFGSDLVCGASFVSRNPVCWHGKGMGLLGVEHGWTGRTKGK